MVDRTPASSGRDSAAAAARGMTAYAPMRPFLLWSVETTRTMIGMQREMMDLTRGVLRQQQDTMMQAMLQGFDEARPADRTALRNAEVQDGFAGLARLSLAAFDRMATALRASNDPGRWTSAPGAASGQSAEPR